MTNTTPRTRLILTGSRDFTEDPAVIRRVLALFSGQVLLTHGANYTRTTSVDRIGHEFWTGHGLDTDPHPANWGSPCRSTCPPAHRKSRGGIGADYCPFAGFYRNEDMAGLPAVGATLALPGGNGTEDMIERSHVHGIPVLRVEP